MQWRYKHKSIKKKGGGGGVRVDFINFEIQSQFNAVVYQIMYVSTEQNSGRFLHSDILPNNRCCFSL